MPACIIAIGNELVRGTSRDTNSAWLASRLLELGFRAELFCVLPDEATIVSRYIKHLLNEFTVILVTGGLGPTNDDVTREAAAEAFKAPLAQRPELVDKLRRFFVDRGIDMPQRNLKQASLPQGAEVIPNPHGTACGFSMRRGRKLVVFMPGVPSEMTRMFDGHVAQQLSSSPDFAGERQSVATRTLRVFGMGEGTVDEALGELSDPDANPSVGLTCAPGLVSIHLLASAAARPEAAAVLDRLERAIRERLPDRIVGAPGERPAEASARLLGERRWRVAFVDGATGGLVVSELAAALAPMRSSLLAGAEVLAQGAPGLGTPDEVLAAAEQARVARGADVAVAVGFPDGASTAPFAVVADGRRASGDVPFVAARADAGPRVVQYVLAELWRFLAATA